MGNSLSYDNMVKRIFMILLLINMQCSQSPYYIHVCIINLNRRIVEDK